MSDSKNLDSITQESFFVYELVCEGRQGFDGPMGGGAEEEWRKLFRSAERAKEYAEEFYQKEYGEEASEIPLRWKRCREGFKSNYLLEFMYWINKREVQ
ncbi:hypothetical protein KY362_02215 [Candidatus Woesearchaeota archaeon]|nr:hypothetical protein [Candidatus Woesearchaeota archaeon]